MFHDAPETLASYCFPILRPRKRQPISFVCGVREWRGTYTHWFGGKTVGCASPACCPACSQNVKRTWQGHLLAHNLDDDSVFMLVFTAPSVNFFRKWMSKDDGIFGLSARFVRLGDRETGPIGCTYLRHDMDRPRLNIATLESVVNRLYADNSNQREVTIEQC